MNKMIMVAMVLAVGCQNNQHIDSGDTPQSSAIAAETAAAETATPVMVLPPPFIPKPPFSLIDLCKNFDTSDVVSNTKKYLAWIETLDSGSKLRLDEEKLSAKVRAALKSQAELDEKVSAFGEEVGNPPKKPIYSGSFQLTGTYNGPFHDGGIVVKTYDGNYYIIENGERPLGFTDLLTGYVYPTGRTIVLSIGRDGRPAMVVRITDDVQYRQDQRDYSASLVTWQKEMQEYARRGPQISALKIKAQNQKKIVLATVRSWACFGK